MMTKNLAAKMGRPKRAVEPPMYAGVTKTCLFCSHADAEYKFLNNNNNNKCLGCNKYFTHNPASRRRQRPLRLLEGCGCIPGTNSRILQLNHVRSPVAGNSELPSSCIQIMATSDNCVTNVELATHLSKMKDGYVTRGSVGHKLSMFRKSQPRDWCTKLVPNRYQMPIPRV